MINEIQLVVAMVLSFVFGFGVCVHFFAPRKEQVKDYSKDRVIIYSRGNTVLFNKTIEQLRVDAQYDFSMFDSASPIDISYRINQAAQS